MKSSFQITLGGKPAHLTGAVPEPGDDAPDFTAVGTDMQERTLLDDYAGKIRVIISVPSVQTSVCATEARKFNEKLNGMKKVTGIVISKDLPFALKNFCTTDGLENIVALSDFRYNDFSNEYGVQIEGGNFKGLLARTVFVVDAKDTVRYVEVVKEIGDEPNYDAVMEALYSL